MGRNSYFQFKQFRIIQENAAFKVGTDAVLLGAWVDAGEAGKILDIGTGTGVIALMMAQRSTAEITGIEVEKNASREAATNAKRSPWCDRVSILNVSFQDFLQHPSGLFDLIISNPPFFSNSQHSKCNLLAMARHNYLLPPRDLVCGSVRLLEPSGRLAVILSAGATHDFIKMAGNAGLHLLRKTDVRPSNLKSTHRCLMEFGKNKQETERSFLNIHSDDHAGFSDDYKMLTRDFYLNF